MKLNKLRTRFSYHKKKTQQAREIARNSNLCFVIFYSRAAFLPRHEMNEGKNVCCEIGE